MGLMLTHCLDRPCELPRGIACVGLAGVGLAAPSLFIHGMAREKDTLYSTKKQKEGCHIARKWSVSVRGPRTGLMQVVCPSGNNSRIFRSTPCDTLCRLRKHEWIMIVIYLMVWRETTTTSSSKTIYWCLVLKTKGKEKRLSETGIGFGIFY